MNKVIKLADYKRPCEHKDFILDYNELQVEYERLRYAYNEIKGILMAGMY